MQETAVIQHKRESEWENADFFRDQYCQSIDRVGSVWSYMFRKIQRLGSGPAGECAEGLQWEGGGILQISGICCP